MEILSDPASLAVTLEERELENPDESSHQLYGQLLAVYLLQNDLMNAKLLWKRIPANYKTDNPELNQIWSVAKKLFNKTYSEVYGVILSFEWPPYVKTIMTSLLEKIREDTIRLIGQSYSHISLEELRKLVGLNSEQEILEVTKKLGWSLDLETNYVLPKRINVPDAGNDCSQEQLQKLTEYVAFLENY